VTSLAKKGELGLRVWWQTLPAHHENHTGRVALFYKSLLFLTNIYATLPTLYHPRPAKM
jgi:hypothetical protein